MGGGEQQQIKQWALRLAGRPPDLTAQRK